MLFGSSVKLLLYINFLKFYQIVQLKSRKYVDFHNVAYYFNFDLPLHRTKGLRTTVIYVQPSKTQKKFFQTAPKEMNIRRYA